MEQIERLQKLIDELRVEVVKWSAAAAHGRTQAELEQILRDRQAFETQLKNLLGKHQVGRLSCSDPNLH